MDSDRPRSEIFGGWLWLSLAALGAAGILATAILAVLYGDVADVGVALLIGWPIVGAALVLYRPGNKIGRLMVVYSLLFGILLSSEALVFVSQQGVPVPALDLITWLAIGVAPLTLTTVVFIIALFPSGELQSSWLRWPLRIVVGVTILGVLIRGVLPITTISGDLTLTNPWGIESLAPLLPLDGWAFGFVALVLLASAVDLVVRWRRSEGVERLQMRALAMGIAFWALLIALTFVLIFLGLEGSQLIVVENLAWATGLAALPVAIGAAVARYRLYDIDVVISKTLVYGALAVLITGLYVGIVVGLGSLLGLYVGGEGPDTLLGLAALVVIPLVFQPARRWLERWANRVVFGRKATPYEVLSGFSQRVAAVDPETLVQVARSLTEGTTAEGAGIWATDRGRLRLVASWPSDMGLGPGGVGATAPIAHDGEELGIVGLVSAPGQSILPTDERLLGQVASGLGLALRNRALTADLESRVEQLRDSRRRIVAVQDRTRRQLERDLHDGAQQRLVALKIKLGLATAMADREGGAEISEILAGLRGQADHVIETVREFARGIYPPLLEAEGLPAALSANFRKAAVPVSLQSAEVGRYPRDTEATAYFLLLTAVAGSVARGADSVLVVLDEEAGDLVFEVRDDGGPVDPDQFVKLLDRVDAASGTMHADSVMGHGTTIRARLPVVEKELLP